MSNIKVLDLPLDEKIRLARSERYACQSVARIALPKERVSKCLRRMINKSEVDVWKHRKTLKAFYGNLAVCGSVWVCPVCAAKISERRRQELQSASTQFVSSGGKLGFLTLTFSHKKTDRLRETLERFRGALKRFFSGKRYQNIRNKIGFVGSVRAFEITYGLNGFHPHVHMILFYTIEIDLEMLEEEFRELWRKACLANQLHTKDEYALTFQDGKKADEYMAKHGTWGLDRELTKAHVKKGKKQSLTPFDFLRKVLEDGDQLYLRLFVEYAEALKGKAQLYWSPGLKDRFKVEEKTDEEVATEKVEEADLLGQIDYPTWQQILKLDKRSYILDLCEREGFEQVLVYLQDIKKDIHLGSMNA